MNSNDITGMALALGLPSVLASHPGVKQLLREAIANEREACAKVAEDFLTSGRSPLGRSVGNAIRARGTA